MNENRKPRIAITHGDTNGIGYEMIFKTFAEPDMLELCTPIIYGSPKVATYHRNALGIQANFSIVNDIENIAEGVVNIVPVFDEEIKVDFGIPSSESSQAGLAAVVRAAEDYEAGVFDILIGAPLDNNEHFSYAGHGRYLSAMLKSEKKSVPILVNEHLKIGLVTEDIPIRRVVNMLTTELIVEKARILADALKRDFRIYNPRIAILGLNPSSVVEGDQETEETDMILPAIETLAEQGVQAFGPYTVDRFFSNRDWEQFDAILAMHYEQGILPMYAFCPECSVVYHAGLPVIAASTLYPKALDNAGKGIVEPCALRQAIYLAIDAYRNQKSYDEPMGNPLPKLYKEKRDESEKARFSTNKHRENNEE